MKNVWSTADRIHRKLSNGSVVPIIKTGAKIADGGIEMTDTDVTVRLDLPCEIIGAGVVNGADRLLKMKPERIEFDDDLVILESGRRRLTIGTYPAQEWPDAPDVGDADAFGADVITAIRECAVAMSDEETRYYLRGVFIDRRAGAVVATNGHIMRVVPMSEIAADKDGVIIPRETIELMRMLTDAAPARHIRLGAERFEIAGDGWSLASRYVRGEFPPDWQRVVPAGSPFRFAVSAVELAREIKEMRRVLGKRPGAVHILIGDDSVTLARPIPGEGEWQTVLDAEIGEEPYVVGASSNYLLATAEALGGVLRFSHKRPVEKAGVEVKTYPLYVTGSAPGYMLVMPMRI